jgi:putative ABC transport system permease protein
MFKLTLRNLWSHKTRLIASVLSIVLGVGFLVGNLVLVDTLRRTFDNLVSSVYAGTDAVVRTKSAFESDEPGTPGRTPVTAEQVQQLAAVEGVEVVAGNLSTLAQAEDPRTKKLLGPRNAPPFGFNWVDDERLNPYDLVDGRAPKADNEIVVDKAVAERGKLQIGETVRVFTFKGFDPYTLVGVARFGDSDSAAGATAVLFTTAEMQRITERNGFEEVSVVASKGLTQQTLKERLATTFPDLEVQTGVEATAEQQQFFREGFINGFGVFLTVFAVIAVLVGSFVIYNAFAIVVAQRNRENALMRAIGAGRGQVMRAQFLETLIIAITSSLIGAFVGLGFAAGLQQVLKAVGFDLPNRGLEVRPARLIVGFMVGVVVTLLSGIAPSIRAGRARPLAALRAEAYDRSGGSKVRPIVGGVFVALSALLIVLGLTSQGRTSTYRLGGSLLLLLIGLIVAGPVIAKPIARIVGSRVAAWVVMVAGGLIALVAAFSLLGVVRQAADGNIGGIIGSLIISALMGLFAFGLLTTGLAGTKHVGRIGKENAVRNPARTSTTAFALTVGVAVIALIATFMNSLVITIVGATREQVRASHIVSSTSFFGFPENTVDIIKSVPGTGATSGVRTSAIDIAGERRTISALTASEVTELIDLGSVAGDLASLATKDSVAVATPAMEENGWKIGDKLKSTFASGKTTDLEIVATYSEPGALQNGYYVVDESLLATYAPSQVVQFIYVDLADGTDAKQWKAAASEAIKEVPTAEVITKKEFEDRVLQAIGPILGLIGALLLLSIIIAGIGIANTLRLSTLERTSEIGLSRAVGMSRAQVRGMVRWEAVIVSLIGAFLGVLLGVGYGMALVSRIDDFRVAVPWIALPALGLVALAIGLLAAARAARSAANLNILEAIATN